MKKIRLFFTFDKGALTDADMKKGKYKLLYALLILYMLVYFAIVLIPVVWMVATGFKEPTEITGLNGTFFPKSLTFSKAAEKIKTTWNMLNIGPTYINTFIMAGGSVIFTVVINGLAGYVLSRLKPKGSRAYFKLVFYLMLLPTTINMVPLYMMFTDFPILHINMMNSYLPIWLMAGASLFDILLFKTSFDSISVSLIESAKIDGAAPLKIFFKIIIPLSVPVITTVAIFAFNGQVGAYFWPYVLISDKNMEVLGVKMFKLKSGSTSIDYKMMGTLFSILPQIIIFALFQKRIIGGINIGGVKG